MSIELGYRTFLEVTQIDSSHRVEPLLILELCSELSFARLYAYRVDSLVELGTLFQ